MPHYSKFMQKIIKYFATTVIVLFILSIFGWTVKHMTKGDKEYTAAISEPIKLLIDFPDLFKASVKEVKTLPETFVKTTEGFNSINNLEIDVNAYQQCFRNWERSTLVSINQNG